MSAAVKIASFQSGKGPTVEIGYTNPNDQRCCGTLGVPETDINAFAYKLECNLCGFVYGANSGDVHERKCPNCQGGKPGVRFWLVPRRAPAVTAETNGGAGEACVELVAVETGADWLERHSGSMKDVPDLVYREFLEHCRQAREEGDRTLEDADAP
jgi:rubredoxin